MGVAARLAPKGLGPQNSTKKLPHWMNLLGQPLSRNHVCGNLGHEPPPPLMGKGILSKQAIKLTEYSKESNVLADKC